MQRNSYCATQAPLVGAVQQDCVTDDELSILDRESITPTVRLLYVRCRLRYQGVIGPEETIRQGPS